MNQILQPAKQERSRETQERILRATQKLLRNSRFESISVRRIIEEAETSIGSFYARFRDKDALLPILYAEYEQKLKKRLQVLQEELANAKSLDQAATLIVDHFVDTYGETPNLSRALFEYATKSSRAAETKSLANRRFKQYAFVFDCLTNFKNEIKHPDVDRAIDLGVYFMVVACRNRLLYPMGPQTRLLKIDIPELRVELVRLLTGYLRATS